MAGEYRTLKLELLAETKQFIQEMKGGEQQVESFGDKATKMGKIAAAAFAAAAAAAAAYAVKLAVDGVKAAIEDEAAQLRLANALKNVTSATDDQIAAVEKQILKTSLATGVADDQLRPALQRLAVATGSVKQSQDLLTLALDISAATGKDVEAVTNALGKAYEGNTGSLTRLGIGLSAAEIKTLGLEGTVKQLADTFGGAATVQANTFEGQIARLKVGFDEAKESVGAALLPTLQKLLDYFINTVIPKFIEFKDAALKPVTDAIARNKDSLTILYNFIKDFVVPVLLNNLGSALGFIGKVAGGILDVIGAVISGIKSAINFAIDGINALIRVYNNSIGRLPGAPDINQISKPSFSAPSISSSSSLPKIASGPSSPSIPSAPKLSITPSAPSAKTPTAPSSATPSLMSAGAFPNTRIGAEGDYLDRNNVVINVNAPSAIDEEGFTRAVVSALNNTGRRTGGGIEQLQL